MPGRTQEPPTFVHHLDVSRAAAGRGTLLAVSGEQSSKTTRVAPVFAWLRDSGAADWPTKLLVLADGITPGPVGPAHSFVVLSLPRGRAF
jgi:hypothetical protein